MMSPFKTSLKYVFIKQKSFTFLLRVYRCCKHRRLAQDPSREFKKLKCTQYAFTQPAPLLTSIKMPTPSHNPTAYTQSPAPANFGNKSGAIRNNVVRIE